MNNPNSTDYRLHDSSLFCQNISATELSVFKVLWSILNSANKVLRLYSFLCPGKEEEAAKWAREEEEAQRRLEESRLRMEEEAARQRLEEEERKRKELELQRQKEIMRQRQQQQEALRRLQQQQQQQQLAQMKVTCSWGLTSFQLSMGSKATAVFRVVWSSLGRAGIDELSIYCMRGKMIELMWEDRKRSYKLKTKSVLSIEVH